MARVGRMKLGSQGLDVSAQGLGCMGMSAYYGPPNPEPDMISLIHYVIDSGVTFLDTSDIYGPFTNEILLGKTCNSFCDVGVDPIYESVKLKCTQALKDGVREKVELATKFGIDVVDCKWDFRGDPQYVRAACEASLKRLGMQG
ncbi:hypothetical protein FNV43_RR02009 [Rhamnella rubrinervis]|uniref:NADP-dependent oxidoreductase domain-containing protein n=1 Tax=Rhamnella rubrinervis TaxID=2594499 RepID=A0A8K0HQP4_9ROSA|nr:hypothetical protein FNV43_RR02009 [Rhamnella rubrinervis]